MTRIDVNHCQSCDEQAVRLFRDKTTGLMVCESCNGFDQDKHSHNRRKFRDDRDR